MSYSKPATELSTTMLADAVRILRVMADALSLPGTLELARELAAVRAAGDADGSRIAYHNLWSGLQDAVSQIESEELDAADDA